MNCFIAFCYSETVGGGQNYLNSKTEWLERNGWIPLVFTVSREYRFFKSKRSVIPWNNLRKYSCYESVYLSMPPEFWSKWIVNRELKRMVRCVPKDAERIIIESHTDFWAEWGELLAQKLHAKNYCYLLDELLERYGSKDFLYFKFERHELAGIHNTSMNRLFTGIKDIPVDSTYVLKAAKYGSVADVYSEAVTDLIREDYNIAYFGRDKQYVPNIIDGVIQFAERHKDKRIHFVVVGNIRESLLLLLKAHSNIVVSCLGFMVPIPKDLFSKIDLFIAGAGCASIAAREGATVIVADAGTLSSSGVLGYTTDSSLFSEGIHKSFDEEMEDVLVNKVLINKEKSLRSPLNPEFEYEKHFLYFSKASDINEYFDFCKNPQRNYSCKTKVKMRIKWHWPILYKRFFLHQS